MCVHTCVYICVGIPVHVWGRGTQPVYMSRPEGAPGCSLSLSTYSFEAGSLPEPVARLFSPELEAGNPPMITSPPALELWLQTFV